MAQQALRVSEHCSLPVTSAGGREALTEAEACRLVEIARIRPGFCTRGYRSVQFAQYVGLVGLGRRMLEVLPKTDDGESPGGARAKLLRLLQLSRTIEISQVGRATHDLDRHALLEVFIAMFLDEVANLVRSGLVRRYLMQEELLPVVRGKLLLGRQIAQRGVRFDQVLCQFDDLTIDHFLNQVIAWTLEVVRPWIDSLPLARRRVELSGAFADVHPTPVSLEAIDAFRFDRRSAPYGPAIGWAKILLRALSPALRTGATNASALLFDMNQLFEISIANVMRVRAPRAIEVSAHHTGLHLSGIAGDPASRLYGIRPDISVHRDGKVQAVADTKWTHVSRHVDGHLFPERSHVYQMQAYASVYDCEEFALIYPWHPSLSGVESTVLRLPRIGSRNPLLRVFCVDLSTDALTTRGPSDGLIAGLLGATKHEVT